MNDRSFLLAMGGSPVASFGAQGLFELRSYYEAVEAFLASSEAERKDRIRAMRKHVDAQMREYLLRSENSLLWEDYFPSELRATVLVAIMSFFERYLNGVCSEVGILVRTRISHRKLKGSLFDRAQVFLTDLCALDAPRLESWESMRQLQHLRNLLVHNGGMPDTAQDRKSASQLADAIPGIEISELGIDMSPSAIRYAFHVADEFMKSVEAAIVTMCQHVRTFEGET